MTFPSAINGVLNGIGRHILILRSVVPYDSPAANTVCVAQHRLNPKLLLQNHHAHRLMDWYVVHQQSH